MAKEINSKAIARKAVRRTMIKHGLLENSTKEVTTDYSAQQLRMMMDKMHDLAEDLQSKAEVALQAADKYQAAFDDMRDFARKSGPEERGQNPEFDKLWEQMEKNKVFYYSDLFNQGIGPARIGDVVESWPQVIEGLK